MKKIILSLSVLVLTFSISCTNEGNKGVVKQEENSVNTNVKEITERYVAEDGSSALVTTKEGEENSISVRSNNKTITAPEKSEGLYGNYDFEIVKRNDSVIITQGDNIISLKKARGQ